MDQGPLVNEEIDAGLALIGEFAKYAPIESAFWMKLTGENQRYLHLVSKEIDDSNFDLAYGEILRIANALDDPYLDPFRVKVSGPDDEAARAIAELRDQFGGRLPLRFGARTIAGTCVDDLYVYRTSAANVAARSAS